MQNKFSKTMPKKCGDCDQKLPCPKYHQTLGPYYIECNCGVVYIWSFPNQWEKSHNLPLFRLVIDPNPIRRMKLDIGFEFQSRGEI